MKYFFLFGYTLNVVVASGRGHGGDISWMLGMDILCASFLGMCLMWGPRS